MPGEQQAIADQHQHWVYNSVALLLWDMICADWRLTTWYRARSTVLLIPGLRSQKMAGQRKLKLQKRRLTVKYNAGGGWKRKYKFIIHEIDSRASMVTNLKPNKQSSYRFWNYETNPAVFVHFRTSLNKYMRMFETTIPHNIKSLPNKELQTPDMRVLRVKIGLIKNAPAQWWQRRSPGGWTREWPGWWMPGRWLRGS